MRQRNVFVLALVAAFATSAGAVSSASAAPTFYKCNMVEAELGKYEDAECKLFKEKEDFEKEQLLTGQKIGFTSLSGSAVLETEKGKRITCKKDESKTGETNGPQKIANLAIIYKECEEPATKINCKSGTVPGEIQGNKLVGLLIYLDMGKSKTGILFEPEAAGLVASFKCGLVTVEVKGSLICEITPKNQIGVTFSLKCKIVNKKQEWRQVEEAGVMQHLDALGEEAALEDEATITSNSVLEIRS